MCTRRIISVKDNAKVVKFNVQATFKHTALREPSVVDEFYHENVVNNDGSESVSILDPIYVLFNQQRLNSIGATAAQSFLDSLQPQNDALAELRKKCSDDDLMSMMKSRHLQSPAEIIAWCRYMQQNVDIFNKEVQSLIEAQAQQEKDKASASVEPSNNSE